MESQSNVPYVLTLFGVYLVFALVLLVLTAKSPLPRNRKTIVYVLTIIGPIIGLIVFLIFRFDKKNEGQ